ncbi:Zinc transporter, putative [Perkinsus marinus ATCC 50983]|uniref:Zinc transporter, putative n=1 Tax=Perkinsus marinus (strain ATCC 50983 / TXsc) TaxID=423536 RepID=C5M0J5_PERM5|nr:Zinc transporter, putative [Perkinsus marinus ATCC 50983]EEQ97497.1 Zinc transporter, putative [Perkinsus marinus ATCC 50983]|eukprot:XP_002764780.1 Zinc transporter, putative [Perkinsus marinus ATCC 50983]
MVLQSPHIGLAIGLTCAAGSASLIGCAIAFLPFAQDSRFLAGCLSLSAGVMVFVSLVEILNEATNLIHEGGLAENYAFMSAVGVFFLGCLLTLLLDLVSEHIMKRRGSSSLPAAQMDITEDHGGVGEAAIAFRELGGRKNQTGDVEGGSVDNKARARLQLLKTGVFTAIAICLHNFPEGIVGFLGTLEEPSVGVSLAFAIGVHNIPEGIAVAAPVLKATGSKLQAFLWTLLSAVAEPLGGILAWLILGDLLGPFSIGCMLGLTAGIMTYIAILKLQTFAVLHDPSNKWAGNGFLLGMFIMALSLVLFRIP